MSVSSEKLRAKHRRYNSSEKGKARNRRYNGSVKGQERNRRYEEAHPERKERWSKLLEVRGRKNW